MKRFSTFVLLMALLSSLLLAQAQDASKVKRKKTPEPSVSERLDALTKAIEAQQQQITALGQQVQSRDQKIQQLEQRLDQGQAAVTQAQSKADSAASQTADEQKTVATLSNDVSDLKLNTTNMATNLQNTQKSVKEQIESPMAVHFKGIDLTPGGFLAAESVYRNRALGADINTPFNSINMPGAGQNAVSEFFGSGRQSRISLLADGKAGDFKMGGYYEADFLSAGITSNNNQSNSYTLRQRQVWGQVASGGSTLTGGQMWSLLTET